MGLDRSFLPYTASGLEGDLADFVGYESVDSDVVRHVRDSQACPEEFLSALAWDWSVDRWYGAWPESLRRQVIDASLGLHREKGTLAAVERVLREVGAEFEIELMPGGVPHTMAVTILNGGELIGRLDALSLRDYIVPA